MTAGAWWRRVIVVIVVHRVFSVMSGNGRRTCRGNKSCRAIAYIRPQRRAKCITLGLDGNRALAPYLLGVAFVLNIGLNILRTHQANLMPQRLKLTRPIIRTATGFRPNQARWQIRQKWQQLIVAQSLTQRWFTAHIDTVQLKDIFRQINTR